MTTPFTSEQLIDTVKLVTRIFPFTNNVDLKIYAILSTHNSIAYTLNDSNARLMVVGAYTLDEALANSQSFLDVSFPGTSQNWKNGVMTTSFPYQHVVPMDKIIAMVDNIKEDIKPKQSDEEVMAGRIEAMEAYCRYVFDKGNATPYEKGILTSVLNRFRNNVNVK